MKTKGISIERKIVLGYWLALFVLVTIAVFTWHNSRQLKNSNYAVAHTYNVLKALDELNVLSTEMQSAMRGYILSPRPTFRQEVKNGEPLLLAGLLETRLLVQDNKEQLQRLNELELKLEQFSSVLLTMISIREMQGEEAARKYFVNSESPRLMLEIKHIIRQMRNNETSYLRTRQEMRDSLLSSFNWLYVSLLSSVFIVMVILYNNIIKTIKKQVKLKSEYSNRSSEIKQ